jgi:molecular chaperone GrpE
MFKKWKKMSNENINEEEITNEEELNNDDTSTETEGQDQPVDQLSDLEKKELEYKELHDKYIRLFSEFDNFRKRTAKEKLELSLSAGAEVMKQIIPTLDDFDRAIANNEKSDDIAVVKEGFILIHNKLQHNLISKGLKAMESQGEDFDVNKHEALTQIPAPSEDLKGKVVDVIEKGYLLNDKVVRFAKVVVGQ